MTNLRCASYLYKKLIFPLFYLMVRVFPDLYLRRFRKEKKWRRKLQEQLEVETKKIQALEAALRSLSYDTLVKVRPTTFYFSILLSIQ